MSGQVGMDQDGTVPEGTIAQLNLALDNVRRNLVAAGLDTSDLAKLTWRFRPLGVRAAASVLICLLVASAGIYYAFFASFLDKSFAAWLDL